jgi:lipopolysaccharide cholinephosphotransferase
MQLAFEDDYFSVPKMYKEYLEMRYGDYMQLPPEDQRVGVHADIIDFDYSYSVLVNRKERSNELKK